MNTLEKIAPPLGLCRMIPAGEFEESALVWVLDPEGIECVMPREVAVYECGKRNMIPAPTLEEIMEKLDTPSVWIRSDGTWHCICKDCVSADGRTASDAALRLWFKVKGIEVKR